MVAVVACVSMSGAREWVRGVLHPGDGTLGHRSGEFKFRARRKAKEERASRQECHANRTEEQGRVDAVTSCVGSRLVYVRAGRVVYLILFVCLSVWGGHDAEGEMRLSQEGEGLNKADSYVMESTLDTNDSAYTMKTWL